jgi:hypothetical protein
MPARTKLRKPELPIISVRVLTFGNFSTRLRLESKLFPSLPSTVTTLQSSSSTARGSQFLSTNSAHMTSSRSTQMMRTPKRPLRVNTSPSQPKVWSMSSKKKVDEVPKVRLSQPNFSL